MPRPTRAGCAVLAPVVLAGIVSLIAYAAGAGWFLLPVAIVGVLTVSIIKVFDPVCWTDDVRNQHGTDTTR